MGLGCSAGRGLWSGQADASPHPTFQRCRRVTGTGTRGSRCRTRRAPGRWVLAWRWWGERFPLPPPWAYILNVPHRLPVGLGRAVGQPPSAAASRGKRRWAPAMLWFEMGGRVEPSWVSTWCLGTGVPAGTPRVKGAGAEDGTEICPRFLRGFRWQVCVILLV